MSTSQKVTYVGIRGETPGHGHGGPLVVGVRRGERSYTLELRDPRFLDDTFEWGYEGAGPARLAQAILADWLNRNPPLALGQAFMREIVAALPYEFELAGEDVQAWLLRQPSRALTSPS